MIYTCIIYIIMYLNYLPGNLNGKIIQFKHICTYYLIILIYDIIEVVNCSELFMLSLVHDVLFITCYII